jgi:pyruvate formate lyase activating enzyme
MYDVAKLSKTKGLNNVMVSNGYIARAFKRSYSLIDAFNIDLKLLLMSFTEKARSSLEPVKQTLMQIREAGDTWKLQSCYSCLNDGERYLRP